jgi:uncharacterized protein (DUF2236 family)
MSLLVVHDAFFGPLPYSTQDRLFRESAVYATSLRMPPSMWPATLADFNLYWTHNIATLPITPWAQELSKRLLWPIHTPIYMRPQWPLARLLTSMWLPERVRQGYGLKDSKGRRGVYKVLRVYVGVAWPLVPGVVRAWPHRHGIRDMRRAVGRIEERGTWVKAG